VSALKDKYAEMFCALSKKIRVNLNKQKNLRKVSFPHWLLDQNKVPRFSQVFFFILYWWEKFQNFKRFSLIGSRVFCLRHVIVLLTPVEVCI
jgi:hypothetical protein